MGHLVAGGRAPRSSDAWVHQELRARRWAAWWLRHRRLGAHLLHLDWMWPSGLAIPSRRRPHRDWGPANESLQADTSASGGADGPTTTRGAITSAAFHWSPPR